jgi:hypothetical protein
MILTKKTILGAYMFPIGETNYLKKNIESWEVQNMTNSKM